MQPEMKFLARTVCALLVVLLGACASLESDRVSLNVSTFNMRCDLEENKIWKGAWNLRKAMIAQMLLERDMDIVASQELYVHQLDDLKKELSGKYDFVETQSLFAYDPRIIDGRNRPAADDCEIRMHNAIWYKASKFSVLEKGSFYLSSTPDKMSFGFEPNAQCRRCVWAKFEDLASGKTFYVFNVHADWENRKSRLAANDLIMEKIAEIAEGETVFLAGDFNDETSESANMFTRSGKFSDSREVSRANPSGPYGTFHNWGANDMKNPANRLDYIFVKGGVKVLSYEVLGDSYGAAYPSDHYPVFIKAEIR